MAADDVYDDAGLLVEVWTRLLFPISALIKMRTVPFDFKTGVDGKGCKTPCLSCPVLGRLESLLTYYSPFVIGFCGVPFRTGSNFEFAFLIMLHQSKNLDFYFS